MNSKYKKIIKAVEKSGQIIAGYFGKDLKTYQKSSVLDFSTQADLRSEKNIIAAIQKEFPTYNILSEERGLIDKKSDYTFVIDPLDGTLNFYLGLPLFTVTLALLKGDEAIFGVTHHPITKQTFYAIKDKWAFENGRRIKVNKINNLERAIVGYTCGWKVPVVELDKISSKLHQLKIKRPMANWSPAFDLCLLASGKIEGIITNNNELHDNLAGKIIVREAGGKLTDFKGKPLKNDRQNIFLASNGTNIHAQLAKIL